MERQPSWNEPKQKRSRKTFEHILDTAATLFAQHGYESVTTNHIADYADVSIGAVYRFFPNKDALLHALIHRYQQRMRDVFPQHFDTERLYHEVLGELVDTLMLLNADEDAFQHIFVSVDAEIVSQMHKSLVGQVKRLIGAYHPQLNDNRLHLCATVGVAIVRGMMPLTHAPDNLSSDDAATEIKLALLSYLGAFLEREADSA